VRNAFYIVSAAIIAWAAAAVPLPLAVLAPALPTPATEAVDVRGELDTLDGQLLITSVSVSPSTTTLDATRALLDQHQDVTLRQLVIPIDVDEEELFEHQRELFRESVRVAAAVGLEHAGRDVHVSGDGARVVRVMPGAPVEDVLEPGDLVIAVDGEALGLATELAARTTTANPGDTLVLTVVRDDAEREIEVTVGQIPGTEGTGLGVLVQTVNQQIDLPEGVDVDVRARIGGPSGGLILALTIYDMFSDENLLDGRTVAGTGVIRLDGTVGPVGGVPKKVRGSELAGADVFLVPAALADEARGVAPAGMEIIPVESLEDALEALRR
jgi:Lon-like protease